MTCINLVNLVRLARMLTNIVNNPLGMRSHLVGRTTEGQRWQTKTSVDVYGQCTAVLPCLEHRRARGVACVCASFGLALAVFLFTTRHTSITDAREYKYQTYVSAHHTAPLTLL